MDQREVRVQRGLQQVGFPVHFDLLLTFLDQGADAGWRQHAAKSATTSTNALDERALWDQVDHHLAGDHLSLRLGIEADVTSDGPTDKSGIDKLAYSQSRLC